jgi:hypothetical protein
MFKIIPAHFLQDTAQRRVLWERFVFGPQPDCINPPIPSFSGIPCNEPGSLIPVLQPPLKIQAKTGLNIPLNEIEIQIV